MLEGKSFYRRREYVTPLYEVPIPHRALSEYELWECEDKTLQCFSDKNFINNLDKETMTPDDSLNLVKFSKISDYWVVFNSLRDFVDGLTFEITTRIRGASKLASHIREISGEGKEEQVKDF